MNEVKFWHCAECGNLVVVLDEGGCTPTCCGTKMETLVADSTDAATEKHVPYAVREGADLKVQVGSVEHPMTEAHLIEWVVLAQGERVEIHFMHPDEKPLTVFRDVEEGPLTVYAYCNLHGLWKCEL